MKTAAEIIAHLGLMPHPEGGHYRQTWVGGGVADRPAGSCIYFLLAAGEVSHWHHVDATEIWHYHAGAELILSLSATDQGPARNHILGPDLTRAAPRRRSSCQRGIGNRRAARGLTRWCPALSALPFLLTALPLPLRGLISRARLARGG